MALFPGVSACPGRRHAQAARKLLKTQGTQDWPGSCSGTKGNPWEHQSPGGYQGKTSMALVGLLSLLVLVLLLVGMSEPPGVHSRSR